MGYKIDIQATQQAATGSVVTPPTRLRGISAAATGTAGILTLTNGNGGAVLLSVNVPANDIYTLNIPEDGIVFPAGIHCSVFTNLIGFTVFTDNFSAPGLTTTNG
tara:strand:- start:811 stop:1125 length:315 start_codon:yes stop_codon:yes gene_type:complete